MAEDWDWSDLEDEPAEDQPKKVDRNDPKSLRQFAKKTADENKELKRQLAEFNAATRTKSIAEKLAEKKIPEKVARLVPADIAPDKVDDWLKDFEDLWAPPSSANQGEEGSEDDGMAEEMAVQNRMSQASSATIPATRPTDLMAQINDPNTSRDQLIRLIEQAGGGYGAG